MTVLTAPVPNQHLILWVLDAIDANPDRWDQTVYRETNTGCGTSFCFAGWACELSGGLWIGNGYFLVPDEYDDPKQILWTVFRRDGVSHRVRGIACSDRARRLCGLTPAQQHSIFYNVYTDPKKLRALVQRTTGIMAVK